MDSKSSKSDPFGAGVKAYLENPDESLHIRVFQEDFDEDELPIPYLFRSYKEMPKTEQKALDLCKGKILDIGAAAGCHSKHLREKGFDVTPLDISPNCIDILHKDFPKATCADIKNFQSDEKYDTMLMLMNGIGVGATIQGLKDLLEHLKTLLNKDGQILLDSTDLRYLYEEEDGSFLIPMGDQYYGETKYQLQFEDHITNWFPWFFIDYDTLAYYAEQCGYTSSLLMEGEHYDYLAKLEWK